MNHNPDELAFFSKQAQDWWNPKGEMNMLHRINPLRLRFITDTCSLAQAKILDVGCGGGILSEAMAKQGAEVTGLDLSPDLIQVAETHAQEQGLKIHYECQALENFADQHPSGFDIITCMEMLEHVPDPESIVKAMAQALKPGGILFLSTIDRSLLSFLKVIVAAEYILQYLPRGTHHYGQFIRPSELSAVVRQCGLQPLKLGGFQFNPFSKTFRLCAHATENYLLCAQK